MKRPFVPVLASVTLAATMCASGGPAFAGDLGSIEGAHKDKKKSSSSSSSSSSSGSSGGGVAEAVVGSLLSNIFSGSGSSSSESSDEGDVPFVPTRALAMESYPYDRPRAYADVNGPNARMRRYGELSLSGFSTLVPSVQALDSQLNLFFSAFTIHAGVTRYYEPEAKDVRSLDLLRLQVGFNALHGWVKSAELHVTGGVLAMHGNDWTPGGGVRTDLRVYPFYPFTLDLVADATFFPHGTPLVEAQLMPGATFARVDLRLGAGLLYQPGVAPIAGPRLQVGIRF